MHEWNKIKKKTHLTNEGEAIKKQENNRNCQQKKGSKAEKEVMETVEQ